MMAESGEELKLAGVWSVLKPSGGVFNVGTDVGRELGGFLTR